MSFATKIKPAFTVTLVSSLIMEPVLTATQPCSAASPAPPMFRARPVREITVFRVMGAAKYWLPQMGSHSSPLFQGTSTQIIFRIRCRYEGKATPSPLSTFCSTLRSLLSVRQVNLKSSLLNGTSGAPTGTASFSTPTTPLTFRTGHLPSTK